MNKDEQLLTVKEVASMLQVSRGTLINWDKSNKLTPIRLGERKLRRYKKEDIEKLINNK